ncbi:cbb3-type cytochrome oxidase assembly protein CcoS [Eudoraea sp.]|uniref:cbb3-type cytochrome oxidase assembly protein CcoS n=1 Tax=Eudoraea sp. TaxID=1979955 RepID=UPI003C71F1BD
MSVIYLLLTISIVVALVFFAAFIISVRSGQYDDSYTPSVRMLFEDEVVKNTTIKPDTKIKKSIQLNKKQNL